MEMQAAVFRKVHEPFDDRVRRDRQALGREVLVRTPPPASATAICTLSTVSAGFRWIARSCSATRAPASSRRSAPT